MKGIKGRFLRKLKFMPTVSSLKQGLVLQLSPPQEFPNQNCHILSVYKEQDCKNNSLPPQSAVEFKDHKDEEMELEFHDCNEDNVVPSMEKAKDAMPRENDHQVPVSKSELVTENNGKQQLQEENKESPLKDFEEKCPPGGEESVIFYTTSLRGIRKTFEECSTIRFLLDSFKISVYERDVSMDMEFRDELWRILDGRAIPPKVFIKGRYIGGADEVVTLHEQGKLKRLLEGIPSRQANSPCNGCANMKFIVCSNCHGSRKVYADGEGDEQCIRCPECNENGLVRCPVCC